MKLYNVVREPRLTEKTGIQYDVLNQAVFIVHKKSNKIEIKESIQKAFNVKVESVRTLNIKGKEKRLGRSLGKRADWKKAVVTLKAGDKISYFEGA